MHPELHHGAALCPTLLRLSVLTRGAEAKMVLPVTIQMFQLPELSWLLELSELWALHCLGEERAVPLLPSL